ncbi:hypothetical protein KC367_g99 [Hortaea werneckii]|nr:hypothetical protein KC367_g99 [Hortaea werneckii]
MSDRSHHAIDVTFASSSFRKSFIPPFCPEMPKSPRSQSEFGSSIIFRWMQQLPIWLIVDIEWIALPLDLQRFRGVIKSLYRRTVIRQLSPRAVIVLALDLLGRCSALVLWLLLMLLLLWKSAVVKLFGRLRPRP